MKIKILCPQWGHEHLPLNEFFKKVSDAGYDGVDMGIPEDDSDSFKKLLDDNNLEIVAHQYQAEGDSFEEYIASFKKWLTHAALVKPLLVNSHSGRDYYSFDQNKQLIEIGFEIAEKFNVRVIHETHRGRFTFSPHSTSTYFEAYPKFRITADFSHWCNVTESYLENHQEIVKEAITRADHIHARVGHMEGPQVMDPRAPEWKEALDAHLAWWDAIVELHKQKGSAYLTFTTEFGPPPYMATIPFENKPIVDQWEVNVYMMELLRERYK